MMFVCGMNPLRRNLITVADLCKTYFLGRGPGHPTAIDMKIVCCYNLDTKVNRYG